MNNFSRVFIQNILFIRAFKVSSIVFFKYSSYKENCSISKYKKGFIILLGMLQFKWLQIHILIIDIICVFSEEFSFLVNTNKNLKISTFKEKLSYTIEQLTDTVSWIDFHTTK